MRRMGFVLLSLLLSLTLCCTLAPPVFAAGNTGAVTSAEGSLPGDSAPDGNPSAPDETEAAEAEEAAEDGNADRQSWSSTRTILVIALFAALLLSVGSFVTYPILQRKVEDLKKE